MRLHGKKEDIPLALEFFNFYGNKKSTRLCDKKSSFQYVYVCSLSSGADVVFDLSISVAIKSSSNFTAASHKEKKRQIPKLFAKFP